MWIVRSIAETLRSLSCQFPVLVLVGPRQVGKTALLSRVFGDHEYVALDLPSVAELAETRPELFLERYPPPVVLDEIQYAPGLFRYLKAYVDRHPDQRGLFVLTGSQNYALMHSVSDSLAGRAAVVPFLGLSGQEWGAHDDFVHDFGFPELLWRGSYPALWAEGDDSPPPDRWYQGYVATYLERDVRNLLNVVNLRDFERFLRACAARTGQILNLSDLGRDVGISAVTAREWLSVLQASGQLLLLEPYHRSLGKRLVKSPKLYLTDSGLAAFLMGIRTADALLTSPQAGALFETYGIGQWLRWRDWVEPSANLWFWRDQQGNEVDLVIERNGRLVPIEYKLSQKPGSKDLRGLAKLRKFYGPDEVAHGFVACTSELPFGLAPDTTAVPGWTTWDLDSLAPSPPTGV